MDRETVIRNSMIDSSPTTYTGREMDRSVAELVNEIINGATECIERGEFDGMKRGKCHVFRESDVCMCKKIDLKRYRM